MARTASDHYDVVVIGAGMSGLAAGIRLAMYDRRVLILERHNAPGGLNSFYSISGRKYDVGLHAMTNYVPPGVKGTPLVKILRQLRLKRDDFDLRPQGYSRIAIPGCDLTFTNEFAHFEAQVADAFPEQIDGFRRLASHIRDYEEAALDNPDISARHVVGEFITDPVLEDMLFLPLMYYGSAREGDMDFPQFAIMFKALFFEGFARPPEGVRQIIRALTDRYRALGGERKMKLGVKELRVRDGLVNELLLDDGSLITADKVLSTIGEVETRRLCSDTTPDVGADNVGSLSFVETITVTSKKPAELGWNDTIVFFNARERFHYARPDALVDPESGVICFPNNYDYSEEEGPPEGLFRLTALANYDRWLALEESDYRAAKSEWFGALRDSALRFLPRLVEPLDGITVATDMFTPKTITRYTGHLSGAIYGAPVKRKRGETHLGNLYLCGTDQGFLGITGAMLSGISMANLHCLGE
ncbi:phytoene desaturase family protein [Rubellicoccus peritrichatus]|uniref:FAD-dependent oxidoreductase n=1 Tax=Rubellicoccus peritrichatus TaxID=3080537 RepID=A0AAQ3QUV6_9BACT|nr:FAD-dependent oxidoreductase [Puniceicoccus sp. CR14]WOO42826.1 FAD-dependent oxidoreductase [Puniceicoccus sp. CR14]